MTDIYDLYGILIATGEITEEEWDAALAEHDREVAATAWTRGYRDGQWSATHQDVNPARNPFRPTSAGDGS